MNEQIEDQTLEVRRNAGLAALVGGASAAVAVAYLVRAAGSGGWLDLVLALVTGAIAAASLRDLLDARTPLLVADEQGVRLREGDQWHAWLWEGLESVHHEDRHGLQDGRIDLFVVGEEPRSLRLGLATTLRGEWPTEHAPETSSTYRRPEPDAAATSTLVEAQPVEDQPVEDQPVEDQPVEDQPVEDQPAEEQRPAVTASPTPSPLRMLATVARAELRRVPRQQSDDPPALPAWLTGDTADEPETANVLPPAVTLPVAGPVEEPAGEPAVEPVIGPVLLAARTRLGLTVDELSERTRIRPHVIEAVEVDDFDPCGGDFYARGHLRTLARVLGVDASPLVTAYDETYADAPVDPRRVFEAELATAPGGPLSAARTGPSWSVLVAAVMALVLAWSVARLLMDSPVPLAQDKIVLNGSGGPDSSTATAGDPVPVALTAVGGGARVVVRDGTGETVFRGDVAFGETRTLEVAPPVRVQTSDGSLEVTVAGEEHGPMGETGRDAQDTYVVTD